MVHTSYNLNVTCVFLPQMYMQFCYTYVILCVVSSEPRTRKNLMSYMCMYTHFFLQVTYLFIKPLYPCQNTLCNSTCSCSDTSSSNVNLHSDSHYLIAHNYSHTVHTSYNLNWTQVAHMSCTHMFLSYTCKYTNCQLPSCIELHVSSPPH